MRIFVPRDAVSLALGADLLANAIAAEAARRGVAAKIIRNGSRGMFWLEPLVEIETPEGRTGFGPMTLADVAGLFADPASHPKALGLVEALPFLAKQQRLTFARCGIIDPLSLADYRAHGGLAGLERARGMSAEAICAEITKSGLRGRGGAGFPTGVKWETVRKAEAPQKYIVCNADEGDSGTFADRMILEADPFCLIEGMAIAGRAVGASQGYVYCRSEYPNGIKIFNEALAIAQETGLLDGFALELRVGAGAYVCGEETALLESLEGKRGMVRAKPPIPALRGLFGQPTVINNLISLATIPYIMAQGAEAYASFGMGRSRGTMPVQLAGNIKHGGLFETAFGITLGELVNEIGGGTASGRPVRAVQAGGPLGAYFAPAQFETPYDYEAFAARNGLIGHGGLVVFDDTANMAAMARFAMEFCAHESCGKCTPCRIGSTRGAEILDRVVAGASRPGDLDLVKDLCETMKFGSLCALGGFTPYPVLSAITHFPEDFGGAALPLAAE
ncbi:NADH-quinone oxidoreductase subunit NuoF [Acidocella sp. MX-AZ02]|uniref:formate dehydrogenase beta subunit n=1 Tax=Acidocella sp. MX-AZ02 TaxID=1214225 RepID=UPI00028E80EF|nr:formate dehydrogenase beta subunit [Acidocella sp. MX-AZ02]EKN00715.1 NAD-dependent formate dehydrogenase subunit beta protein [Acidocella sp. MX-AZ02]